MLIEWSICVYRASLHYNTSLHMYVCIYIFQELLDIDVESPSAVEHSNGGCDSTDGNGTIKDCNGTGNVLSVIHNPSNGMTLAETKRPNQLKITREDILTVDQLGASWATVSMGVYKRYVTVCFVLCVKGGSVGAVCS